MNTMDVIDSIDFMDLEDLEFIGNNRDIVHRARMNPFEHFSEQNFKKRFMFSKAFAGKIVDLIKDDLPCDPRGGSLCPQIQVACALRCWTRHQIQDDSADLHGISQQVVSKSCKNVAAALAKQANVYINMPSTPEEQLTTMEMFRAISNFPNVIGAIDCTHIKIKRVGRERGEEFVKKKRKGYSFINVQVICDAQLKICDIVARWSDSAHDEQILNESSIIERFENGDFPGKLLGDSSYGCTPYLFTPVANTQNAKEEAYNRAHIQTRNTIERCLSLWKQRFKCLLRGMQTKVSTAITKIIALAVLHNIAIDMNEIMETIPYVRRRRERSVSPLDTFRGDVERRNFIQKHF